MSLLSRGTGSLIPISVLTGFLGSGKTTVLNRLVRDPLMSRALVIINEFGAIGFDHELVARSTEDLVVEMMGGCLCCTIRGHLQQTLRDAPFRFARDGKCWFDRVVIETTGLADLAPILHTLMTDDHLQTLYRLDGVITTVDAVTGMATLDAQEESLKQAAVADRVLLTKTDLASDVDIRALEARLRTLNPAVPIFHVIDGMVEPARLFDAGLYNPATKNDDVQRWLNAEGTPRIHRAKGGLGSVRLNRVIAYIDAHLETDIGLSDLAAVAEMSPGHFGDQFKIATELTPFRFILERRIARAKELLLDRDIPIAEVALRAGFANQSHLTVNFRKLVRTTPARFRADST
ncbi:MAG: GTP-binding protein [Sphingobium sp.]